MSVREAACITSCINNSCPAKNETSTRCWCNIGPLCAMPAHHNNRIGSSSHICWVRSYQQTRGVVPMLFECWASVIQTKSEQRLATGREREKVRHILQITLGLLAAHIKPCTECATDKCTRIVQHRDKLERSKCHNPFWYLCS